MAEHPEIADLEADFERQIQAAIKKIDLGIAKKGTADQSNNESFWYDIPIVVHVIHDYNTYNTTTFNGDFIPDDFIYKAVRDWNIVFAKKNADTADVIAPFKKWIGNPRIRLHLATVDPYGNPTKGILRKRSYLTYAGGDDTKFENWPNNAYMNLWFINKMSADHSQAAAYAYKPSTAAFIPYYDGVIALAGYMNNGSKTLPHELGHEFNLSHTWGDTNQPDVACGDDNVDDTPPTKGHNTTGCTASSIYDSTCATNYFKIYTDTLGNIQLINYPDTTNAQNIMDYTYCDKMFTKGQVQRMHLTLNSDIAGRNNLWDSTNLVLTGAMQPMPDLKPTPDFSLTYPGVASYLSKNANFAFPDKDVTFTNFSYNDTVTNVDWTFTNGSTVVTKSSITNFNQQFSVPGWYDVKMVARGNNSGDAERTWSKAFYVADPNSTSAAGYIQEFAEGGDRDKWAMFNYFNNEFKWEYANVGVYDNSCVKYKGYDDRYNPPFARPLTGTPKGDYDDLFSIPFNVTGMGSSPYLYFHYSGATRSSATVNITDTLLVEYSVNKGVNWNSLAKLGKSELFNKGSIYTPYTPTVVTDWVEKGIKLPANAVTNYTIIRFRYKPNVGSDGMSTGNNFFLDRVSISPFAVNVNNVAANTANVLVLPNPTQGDAYVVVKSATNTDAKISVTDITGKVVYTAEAAVTAGVAQIQIPASAIATKGMYLVQVLTGSETSTQKLVVY
ncbi:hypothetical protein GCM10023093_28110 [Nemorincola caseinilytica]|uniref:PKD domain-containing protein n=2 Tax=Nemorincola caseinilytica TaxID=2054315 RepID=A0ABP8NPW3_9BACT